MNTVMKIFLSMSFSGGLLILALFLLKQFLKDKISRQWQYYIWLVVILRLLLPFGPETNLLGKAYRTVEWAVSQSAPLWELQGRLNVPEDTPASAAGLSPDSEYADGPAEDLAPVRPLRDIWLVLANHIWLIWLTTALGMLIRKVTVYQGFMRYIGAGLSPVSDMEMLNRLSVAAEKAGIRKPVELTVNPLISSPLLTGFFHPCIVLPGTDISEKDFGYIVLHELTHYRRRDMFYKWLVQVTVCLHWFNPLVHLMSREITRACEFSCDEAVLAKMGCTSAQEYGKTLLDAMAAVGKYKENLGSVTLSENKQMLKERIGAIMRYKVQSRAVKALTAMLTLCVGLGAVFIGVYTMGGAAGSVYAAGLPGDTAMDNRQETEPYADAGKADKDAGKTKTFSAKAERYYEAGSLPLFQIAFSRLDEKEQSEWLDRIYAEGDIAFWGAAVTFLNEDCDLINRFAEKIYEDDSVAYFSTLAMHMSEETLEVWLDRALEDGNWGFQSMLFNALGWGMNLTG